MYTKEEEEKKFIMSTGMFHKCQMGIEFDIYEWGEINFFFSLSSKYRRKLESTSYTALRMFYIWHEHEDRQRERVECVCVRMYVCLYIHC